MTNATNFSSERMKFGDKWVHNLLKNISPNEMYQFIKLLSFIGDTPLVYISLLEHDKHQTIKACIGLSEENIPYLAPFLEIASLNQKDSTQLYDLSVCEPLKGSPLLEQLRSWISYPLNDSVGYNIGTIGLLYDSPKKLREEQLQAIDNLREAILLKILDEKEKLLLKQYEYIFKTTPDLIGECSFEGYFVRVNETFTRILGWTEDDLKVKPFFELIHPEDIESTIREMGNLANNQTAPNSFLINRYITKQGEYRYIQWTGQTSPVNGTIYAVGRDVTQDKENELKLIDTNKKLTLLNTLLNQLQDSVQVSDEHGNMFYINNEASERLGISANQINEYRVQDFELIFKNNPDAWTQHVEELKQVDSLLLEGLNINQQTGREFPVEVTVKFIEVEGQGFVLASSRDITERKRTEQELRRIKTALEETNETLRSSEERWKFALEGAGDGVWDWDCLNNKVFLSDQWKNIIGYEAHEIGNDAEIEWFGRLHPEDKEYVFEKLDVLVQEKTPTFVTEYRFLCKDGSYKWILNRGKVIDWGSDNRPLRIIGTHTDISENKRLLHQIEEHVKAIEKQNKELEHFTYIASHDLQEPLRTVTSFLALIERKIAKYDIQEDLTTYFGFINSATLRMKNLIKALLDYSRIGKAKELANIDVEAVIKTVIIDLNSLIQTNEAQISYAKMPVIKGYSDEFRMLMLNLINNAIKFRKKTESPTIRITATDKGFSWLFSVSDNGIGIEDKYLEKVFMIFQRLHTKEEYEGTGIGLAHCQKIIEMHRGRIWIESVFGEGTTLFFTIPKII